MIRCLIIDDERLARDDLRILLEHESDFQVLGEAVNGSEGMQLIKQLNPDVIFLDIEMPGLTGFEMLEKMETVPHVIFTTAYDQYAIQAFEFNALDYLLKPIRQERMQQTLQKVRSASLSKQVFIKDGDQCHLVKLEDVECIESIGNYARFHFNGQRAMMNTSLNKLEARLNRQQFFRVNRKEIINISFIDQITPKTKSALSITLKSGLVVDVTERRSVQFKERMRL